MSTSLYTETVRARRPLIDGRRERAQRVARALRAPLEPLLPLIADSSVPRDVRTRRSLLFVDWSLRRCLPVWLRAAGLDELAAGLALRAPIEDAAGAVEALPAVLRAAWETRLLSRLGATMAADDYLSTWFSAWRLALQDLGAEEEGAVALDRRLAQDAWSALEQAAQVVAILPPAFARATDEMRGAVQALVIRMCAIREPHVRPGTVGAR